MNPPLENEVAPNDTDARLGAYLDGELDAAARAEMEAELATDTALREQLDRLVTLRSILADAREAFAVPDPGELAFERVRRSIHEAIAPAAPVVTPTATPRLATARTKSVTKRRVVVGFFVAAAAAAGIVGVVSLRDGTSPARPGTEVATRDLPPAPSMNGTEIVNVEFGKMSGTYWEESEGDQRVAIVWIDDSFPEEVGRP